MIWVLIICIVVLLLYWLSNRPNYYKNRDSSDFKKFIEGLIRQGIHGTLLFIKHKNSNKFVQFAKYITEDNEILISFGFPDAKWSRKYFNLIRRAFENEGIKYKITKVGDDKEFVRQYIDIDNYVKDIKKTAEELSFVAEIVFREMDIDKNDKYTIHFKGRMIIQ